jgi:hypothetical protein
MFSVCVCVCDFLCLCTGRGLARSWSPAEGVLPTVPDQETEETQPHAPKVGASSQVWEQRGRKTKSIESQPKFRRNISPPYSGLKNETSKRSAWSNSQAAGSASILKLEATYFSETPADLQRTTQRYNPEDRIPHNHRHENLTYYITYFFQKDYVASFLWTVYIVAMWVTIIRLKEKSDFVILHRSSVK